MDFDIIVIGGGHAGIEASLAGARLGCRTLLITQNPDTIGKMSCNPAIGGLSKGNLVREIDALGGEMGLLIDETLIQWRMLNRSRGPAVQAPRAQADKLAYSMRARRHLEQQSNLTIFMDTVTGLIEHDGTVLGVITERGNRISARAVVIASGTFMEGRIFIGPYRADSGRLGEPSAKGLGDWLRTHGFPVGRLKTGTPARIKAESIDFSVLERQDSDTDMRPFSFMHDRLEFADQPCYITWTNEHTHAIIRANIDKSPLFSGDIVGVGPRYCPSIEDKVVKFPHRHRHQIFVEPEGTYTNEMYLNGLSSSLPEDVQRGFIKTMPGFESAIMVRPGYAVEYDYVNPQALYATLESKLLKGLFIAGQTNGTSGYEEAGAQGLIAGINAAMKVKGGEPLIVTRNTSYIGVLIDDLVTLGTKEPYRMFTSRAERKLSLRQDTADRRLTPLSEHIGLASEERLLRFREKIQALETIQELMKQRRIAHSDSGISKRLSVHVGKSVYEALRDPELQDLELSMLIPALGDYPREWVETLYLDIRYSGYEEREARLSTRLSRLDTVRIPEQLDYALVTGLSNEGREKLAQVRPATLGQAGRISGIRPADIALLAVWLTKNKSK
ncbi:MAG TPA: tRNA uridine-5-carboxymethylaminomethyl(34) synthesis enzyme MnmG [Spirochaetales bacterium]|nr:tRNA uridine-5-carboxymethylaminomethyl(34) synthesis enzyme MnmG [Spirochaetales bacterium]